ncbi:MAG TPA: hypothetical protein VFL95_11895, partial [Gemmatimonadales bacterium]|nr:hypothetical protein [Gemmatimonadales bacterium]
MDRFTPGGQWVRALHRGDDLVVVRAAQSAPDQLAVEIDAPQALHAPALATVVRMLGVERDVAPFHSAANAIPWLAPLADRMLGLKPPRYPTLWEASVNAIVFQ